MNYTFLDYIQFDYNSIIYNLKEPLICIALYVDCSERGGYDVADLCRLTCKEGENMAVGLTSTAAVIAVIIFA